MPLTKAVLFTFIAAWLSRRRREKRENVDILGENLAFSSLSQGNLNAHNYLNRMKLVAFVSANLNFKFSRSYAIYLFLIVYLYIYLNRNKGYDKEFLFFK